MTTQYTDVQHVNTHTRTKYELGLSDNRSVCVCGITWVCVCVCVITWVCMCVCVWEREKEREREREKERECVCVCVCACLPACMHLCATACILKSCVTRKGKCTTQLPCLGISGLEDDVQHLNKRDKILSQGQATDKNPPSPLSPISTIPLGQKPLVEGKLLVEGTHRQYLTADPPPPPPPPPLGMPAQRACK